MDVIQQLEKYMVSDSTTNTSYSLMINNKIITHNNKIIYVRVKLDNTKNLSLEIGTFVKVNNKSKFINMIDTYEDSILDLAYSSQFGNVNLSLPEEEYQFIFEINQDLRIVSVKSNVFQSLLSSIYIDSTSGKITIANRTISDSEKIELADFFDKYSILAYKDLLERKIYRKLSKAKKLTFYYLFNAYRPVLVKGKCVFNPLMDSHKHRKALADSKLFSACSKHEVRVGDLTVYFATDKALCDSLNFKGYTRLSNTFIGDLIYGLFNNSFPSARTSLYINTLSKDILTEDLYVQVPIEERSSYVRTTSLYGLCSSYAVILGGKNPATLYKIVEGAELLR